METTRYILEFIIITLSAIVLVVNTNALLLIHEQENFELKSIKRMLKFYYTSKWQFLNFALLIFVPFLGYLVVQIIFALYLIALIVLSLINRNKERLNQVFKIYIYYFLLLVVGTIFSTFLLYLIPLPELISSLAIIILILPFLIFIVNLAMFPVEEIIKKSKTKLENKEETEKELS